MKKLLLAIVCFASGSVVAQVTPEFIYTNGYVSPLNLDGAVAKYSFVDGVASEVKVFNANHSLWKTVGIPGVETTNNAWAQIQVSTTLFNSDTLLEVVYRTVGDTAKLITETGAVLFSADSAKYVSVSVLAGAPPAIIVNEPLLGGLNPMHSIYRGQAFTRFGPRSGWFAYRAYLSNGSEVGISSMTAGSWISAQAISGTGSASLNGGMGAVSGRFLSDNVVNNDARIEGIFDYPGSTPNTKILASDGAILLTNSSNAGQIQYSKIAGQPDKIIVQDNTENQVYAIPGLQLEYTYAFGSGQFGANGLNRVSLETSGVKYYRVNPTTNNLELYNDDHTFWKSVSLVVTSGAVQSPRILDISEKTVNSDNHVEVIYEQLIGNRYHGRVTNDLQGSLFIYDVKQSGSTTLHRFPDGTAKLIVYQDTASQTHTRIYGFPMTIPASIEDPLQHNAFPFTVAPNPAEKRLNIVFSSAAFRTISLFDARGMRVYRREGHSAIFSGDVAELPRGLYGVEVWEGENRYIGKAVLQ